MLKIQCAQCGQTLKAKEINVSTFDAYVGNVKYKDYATTCMKCGGFVIYERIQKLAEKNKAKAMGKAVRATGKSSKQLTEEQQYNTIMRKVSRRAREIASTYKENVTVHSRDLYKAIDELPKDEKAIMLAYEDKMDMRLLKAGTHKPTKHITPNAILLLTQAIIEDAIINKDEDFFQFEYGAQVVDTYNTALTIHTHTDYEVTAELLLEKMRKGKIRISYERVEEDEQ